MLNNFRATDKIYRLSAVLILIFISLSILSCTKGVEEKKYVIGILSPNPVHKVNIEGFKKELTGHGYIEDKNITYKEVNNADLFDSALRDFKEENVDLILAATTPAARKAKKAVKGTDIPLVIMSFDPVRSGIVKSLIRKEDNITGLKTGSSTPKALEWLLLTIPDIKHIFVPVKFDTKAAQLSLDDLKETAGKFNVDLFVSEVATLSDLREALASMPEDIDAVFMLHSIFVVSNLDMILETALKRKIPTVSGGGLHRSGVTIAYGQDRRHSGEHAGKFAHRILQGYPAADLPFETATFSLGINLDNANKIGLEIPEDILKQANIIRPAAHMSED